MRVPLSLTIRPPSPMPAKFSNQSAIVCAIGLCHTAGTIRATNIIVKHRTRLLKNHGFVFGGGYDGGAGTFSAFTATLSCAAGA